MWPPFGAPEAFYNQRWVQEALGVPVNFTLSADAVVENFFSATGDPMIPSYKALEAIVDAGVGVAFVYGDLDYQCNCESKPLAETFVPSAPTAFLPSSNLKSLTDVY